MLSFNPILLPSREMTSYITNANIYLVSASKVLTKDYIAFQISTTQASTALYSFFMETGVGWGMKITSYLHLKPMLIICGVSMSRPIYALIELLG
jgi:hypothetical protein